MDGEDILNTGYVNTQSPANTQDVTAQTPDSQMGIPGFDINKALADIISNMAGATPSKTELTGGNNVLAPAYYTPDANRPVIIGQTSAGIPLMSAGIPMFSMSVLQQAEEELKEAKRQKYLQKIKDLEELGKAVKPVLINDNLKQQGNLAWQHAQYEPIVKDIASRGVYGFKEKQKIAEIQARINAAVKSRNDTYELAKDIIASYSAGYSTGNAKEKNYYISKDAYNAADEYIKLVQNSDVANMNYEEFVEIDRQYAPKLIKAMSLAESTKPAVEGIDKIIRMGKDWIAQKSFGEDVLYAKDKKSGLAALEKGYMDEYEPYMKQFYDNAYGNYDEKYRPSYDEYKKTVFGQVKNQIEEVYQTLSSHAPDRGDGNKKKNIVSIIPSETGQAGAMTTKLKNIASFKSVPIDTQLLQSNNMYSQSGVQPLIGQDFSQVNFDKIVMYDNIPFAVGGVEDAKGKTFTRAFTPLTPSIYERIRAENTFVDSDGNEINYPTIDTPEQLQKVNNMIMLKSKEILDVIFKITSAPAKDSQNIINLVDAPIGKVR